MYVADKEDYDAFFKDIAEVAEKVDKQEIIDTHLQSSIKNTQLRQAFKAGEDTRAVSLHLRPQLDQKLEYFENEMQIIGQYIRSRALDEEIRLSKMHEEVHQQRSRAGLLAIQNGEGADARDEDENRQVNAEHDGTMVVIDVPQKHILLYPMSLEGMKLFLEEVAIKSRALNVMEAKNSDRIEQFNSGFRHCMAQALLKMNKMHVSATNKVQFDGQELKAISKLSKRYLTQAQQGVHADLQAQATMLKRLPLQARQ